MICSFGFSQNEPTKYTECKMSVEDILRQQSFHIDEPISETSGYVLKDLYSHMNKIYIADENGTSTDELYANFKETLLKAEKLQLNLTMFEEDFENINKITQ
ncbi:hypothetical protein DXU93_05830 [Brumimicrobium aurantiacum]|uniref:Uncharacterized protein n=2 Tax=Brumimicrobium aurantiacum TaxID=1737063 RepID=A0A3E1EY62_9FLAO|nr:hypothetical protein DXU93_05830 [Brumimicrobium aurantiacum]